ncbi:MAG: glycosyltransferase family 4 protein, partial [Candidatus Binatia bacterium]|nr:glycosyltransferase family 4 protein [Candidatus Binatia bacterium]
MRIIHTCLRYPPATGGVETYVKQLVERTRNISAHRDVRVLTSAMRTHGPVTTLNPELLLDDPPYIQRLFTGTTPFVSYPKLQALPYYLKHHQPDIIHAHSFWYQPADTASRYAKKHHIPFVFNPFFYTNKIRHKPLWRLYAGTIGKKTFANADAVIVISPYEQKLIEKNNFPVKRFVLIPPGVTVNQSTPAN